MTRQPLAARSLPLILWLLISVLHGCGGGAEPGSPVLLPAVRSDAVPSDADDPAIWVNHDDPAQSLILGTNKVAAPDGALFVFGLDGKQRQVIDGIDRPNNVDVEYGLQLGSAAADIAVLTERLQSRLRVFRISPERRGQTSLSRSAQRGVDRAVCPLRIPHPLAFLAATPFIALSSSSPDEDLLQDVSSQGGIPVFEGEPGEAALPMGIALYRRPADGAIFAIVGRKTGPREGYLWQYRLEDDGAGRVKGAKVREFGSFSGDGEIEAIAVDDELGYVYFADELAGIRKWHADPDHADAGRELALFGTEGFEGDREGIAIYAVEDGTGYVICTDQIEGNSRYLVFRREGAAANPHDHSEVVRVIRGGADETDGIDATSASLGPRFPNGLLAAMNSGDRNFLLFDWADVARTGEPAARD